MFFISDLYKIKNLLPIIYLSHDINSVAKFIMLYDRIKFKYPNIEFFFVVHDGIACVFKHKFIMAASVYEKYKRNFAKEYVLTNGEKSDVVEKFCEDNNIDIFFKKSNNYQLSDAYIFDDSYRRTIETKCKISCHKINDYSEAKAENFGIAAPDSPDLLYFASEGRKIILIQSELNKNSFQKMFPDTITLQ
jgi:hypothetical protein